MSCDIGKVIVQEDVADPPSTNSTNAAAPFPSPTDPARPGLRRHNANVLDANYSANNTPPVWPLRSNRNPLSFIC